MAAPRFLIVMGVAGCGKTTVAEGLSEKLGQPFQDGDSFHPAANVAKMASGQPLDDEDRWPWLGIIAAWIEAQRQQGISAIVTCSSLKKSYRAALLNGHKDVTFVYLKGSAELLTARIDARKGHFMPPALLQSQLATLEEPGADEPALTVSIDAAPEEIIAQILKALEGLRAMNSDVHIPIEELKTAICAMIDQYKIEMNTEELTINETNDWYWSTGIAGALVVGPDQPELTIGDAAFDWECISSMMKDSDEPIAIMLMKVSPLLQLMVREIISRAPKDADAPAAG